jgi:hypothetical protein
MSGTWSRGWGRAVLADALGRKYLAAGLERFATAEG